MNRRMGFFLLAFAPMCGLTQEHTDHNRVVYEGEALPDELSFIATASMLESMSEVAPAAALEMVGRELRLPPEEAQGVLDSILAALRAYGEEKRVVEEQLLCPSVPLDDDGIYQAFDAVDDSSHRLGQKYLRKLEQDLGEEIGGRFHEWIKVQKMSISWGMTDHRAQAEAHDINIRVIRDDECARLAQGRIP